jgi:vacuolar-type H+-ATPase subunit I/STV1
MKEILTQLFGDAVTDDAMKQFNAELGKKFVAKADFNAKVEEVKTLKGEKKTLEDEVSKLNENANGNEDVKKELEALKAKIDADAKQAEAERISREKAESDERLFNEAVGEKKFSHDAVKSHYFNLFRQDLAKEENKGKSAVDILHNLTKDDATAFTGVTAVKLQGGRPMGTGHGYSSVKDIMNSDMTREQKRAAIAENIAKGNIE